MIDYILIAVVLISLGGIITLISRKVKALTRSSVLSPKQHKELQTKEQLIAKRLERKFSKFGITLLKIGKPIYSIVKSGARRVHTALQELESRYHHRTLTNEVGEAQAAGHAIIKLNSEVSVHLNDENYKDAEKKLIEMISLDPMNADTYRKLGELYIETKQYDLAKETYNYVITLVKKKIDELEINDGTMNIVLASDYLNLGSAHRSCGQNDDAVQCFEKACQLDRNNPKNLDYLLDSSLEINNKPLAWEAFDRLKETNPSNQKLEEYRRRLNDLEHQKVA